MCLAQTSGHFKLFIHLYLTLIKRFVDNIPELVRLHPFFSFAAGVQCYYKFYRFKGNIKLTPMYIC